MTGDDLKRLAGILTGEEKLTRPATIKEYAEWVQSGAIDSILDRIRDLYDRINRGGVALGEIGGELEKLKQEAMARAERAEADVNAYKVGGEIPE